MSSLTQHLEHPRGRGVTPPRSHAGAAGGAACGDLIRISAQVCGERVSAAGFDASGCGSAIAAGSAATTLLERSADVLEAARIGPDEIAAELGGLSPAKRHAAELAADALHRALGAAARADARLAAEPSRTLVAMSGGVDSAVAALLCPVGSIAVTLELWSDPENDGEASCCSSQSVRSARALAHRLKLPHFALDLRAEFRAGVVDPWLEAHAAGDTPNPCVRCNGSVRLDAMLEFASRLGAQTLATGHYARLERGLLRTAADPAKDQSYMLAALAPQSLARMSFPLGALRKAQVRELAEAAGLPVARKPDSQDLCFLAGTGRARFLAKHARRQPAAGMIVDSAGHELGAHDGQHHFTVGQRRGLRVGGGSGEPLYVLGKRADTVVVGPRSMLEARRVRLRELTLHRPAREVDGVRLRYHARTLSCALGEELELHEPAFGAAPGQLACLMSGELVVGHATIAA
ncbi:MAG: tRNA 2-thiouridine(34) synthase MnmA [Solirubrobacteraceae bacterium]